MARKPRAGGRRHWEVEPRVFGDGQAIRGDGGTMAGDGESKADAKNLG